MQVPNTMTSVSALVPFSVELEPLRGSYYSLLLEHDQLLARRRSAPQPHHSQRYGRSFTLAASFGAVNASLKSDSDPRETRAVELDAIGQGDAKSGR